MRIVSLSLISIVAFGCAADPAASNLVETSGPGAKADSADTADRDCRVVMRTLDQPFGLPTNYVNGATWVVYDAMVDVANDAEGAPRVMFSSNSTDGWWQLEGTPVDGGADGYQRYQFTLDRNTVAAGDSTAWREMRIDVVALLETEGARLFDHNRFPGDFDNFTITEDSDRFADDPNVCY
jgi:hypothetical protein